GSRRAGRAVWPAPSTRRLSAPRDSSCRGQLRRGWRTTPGGARPRSIEKASFCPPLCENPQRPMRSHHDTTTTGRIHAIFPDRLASPAGVELLVKSAGSRVAVLTSLILTDVHYSVIMHCPTRIPLSPRSHEDEPLRSHDTPPESPRRF